MKYNMKSAAALLLSAVLALAGCGGTGENAADAASSAAATSSVGEMQTTNAVTTAQAAASAGLIDPGYSDRDLASTWNEVNAAYVTLDGESISYTGSNAVVDGGSITITSEGTYVFSGSLTAGQIIVEAANTHKVQLVLNGVSITSPDGPAIYVKQADKVFITLAEGSDNTIADSASYTLAEGEDEPNAAVFSKDDLTINGSGALDVTGNYRHGILSKDDLVITGGEITVNAVEDGIRGKDAVAIYDGKLSIAAAGDGIKSNNDEEADRGWVSIDGGSIYVEAGEDGIQAETVLQVTGGDLDILAGGGSANAPEQLGNDFGRRSNQVWASAEAEDTTSMKGMKAGTALYVTGGTLNIDSADDSVHSNGTVTISGGQLTLATGDDGVHADGTLLVEGGVIDITKSYEGLEGVPLIITGGDIHLVASDDGLNSAGDDDMFGGGMGDREQAGPGGAMPDAAGSTAVPEDPDAIAGVVPDEAPASAGSSDTVSGETYIRISGGLVVIDAGGDGIDSNREFYMEGGTVLVNGPTNSGNGPLDLGSGIVSGGTIIAAGSAGMAVGFTSSSTQPSILLRYSQVQAAGTLLTLTDDSGSVIVSFAPSKDYQSVVISSPDMELDSTYTLYSGGTTESGGTDGLYTGSYTPGTEVISIALTSVTVSTTDTGEAFNSMGGGPGGGMRDGAAGRDTQAAPPDGGPSGGGRNGAAPNAAAS